MVHFFGWFFLSLLGYVWLGYFMPRTESWQVLGLFAALFGGYAWAMKKYHSERQLWPWLVGVAFVFRLALLGATPSLSDDFYRFFWDGHLLVVGKNPYLILPSNHPDWPLFGQLNSPNYFTVYPPLHQALTALGPWLFPGSLLMQIVVLRLEIVLAETATVWLMSRLLDRYGMPRANALLYALNPLVVVELTGNLHLEGVMIFFLLGAVLLFEKSRWLASALSWGAAVAVKLVPLAFLPLLVRRLGWERAVGYTAVVGAVNALLFAPFFSWTLVENVASSLNLYFQKFEFNASVYYLVRAVGYRLVGYNVIQNAGPLLAAVALLLMGFVIRWQNRQPDSGSTFFKAILLLHTTYLAFATTVHPWYVTSLVGYAVFTPFRYAVVWSALVVLSYTAYGATEVQENSWLIALEYVVVYFWLFAERGAFLRTKLPSKSTARW